LLYFGRGDDFDARIYTRDRAKSVSGVFLAGILSGVFRRVFINAFVRFKFGVSSDPRVGRRRDFGTGGTGRDFQKSRLVMVFHGKYGMRVQKLQTS